MPCHKRYSYDIIIIHVAKLIVNSLKRIIYIFFRHVSKNVIDS